MFSWSYREGHVGHVDLLGVPLAEEGGAGHLRHDGLSREGGGLGHDLLIPVFFGHD